MIDPETIRVKCHELLDRVIDAKIVHRKDSITLGRYNLDTSTFVINIDCALDATVAAFVATQTGGDPLATLGKHRTQYYGGVCATTGIPGAVAEIAAIEKEWIDK